MAKRKIYVGPADSLNSTQPVMVEGLVVDTFTPGELVTQTVSGLATSTVPGTTASSEVLIAIEQGAHVGADITTAWVVGETGKAVVGRSGEFINVSVAAGNNITTKGTAMASNADGTLKIAVIPVTIGVTSEQVLFFSDEIVNVTGSAALVRMRVA